MTSGLEGVRGLVADIAQQTPEKPDYWNSCSQCESNIDRAQAALAHQPAAVAPVAWLCTFGEVSGVTNDPKWRDVCARLGQQITPLVPALAQQPAAVDEFVTIDGKRYDVYIVRTALLGLASDLATQHQEPTT